MGNVGLLYVGAVLFVNGIHSGPHRSVDARYRQQRCPNRQHLLTCIPLRPNP
jgi:hypothetical protein